VRDLGEDGGSVEVRRVREAECRAEQPCAFARSVGDVASTVCSWRRESWDDFRFRVAALPTRRRGFDDAGFDETIMHTAMNVAPLSRGSLASVHESSPDHAARRGIEVASSRTMVDPCRKFGTSGKNAAPLPARCDGRYSRYR